MDKPKRILIVDDEETSLKFLKIILQSFGHKSELARDGDEALEKLDCTIDLVLLDVILPGMNGFEVAKRIRGSPDYGDVPIIMVTALEGKEDRLRAVEAGANDFISKPVDMTELRVRTASLLKMKEAQDAVKRHEAELEEKVRDRTVDLRHAIEDLVAAKQNIYEAHLDTIHRLVVAAEYKDEFTGSHIERISSYCAILAGSLRLPHHEVEIIQLTSKMHDIGKIGIPDSVLLKPGKHTPEEWEIMKQHTVIGARILHGSPSELLQAGEIIALSHHEKWDGSGYPNGLAGEGIPLSGRICAVADAFDALTTKRPYKEAFSNEKAIGIMKKDRGKHFEPRLLDLFLENIDEVFAVQERYRDMPVR